MSKVNAVGGARWKTLLGFALLCVAFAMPVIGSIFGMGNSVQLTKTVPEQLGALLFVGGITFFITRNRSDHAKSIGTLVVGAFMCLSAFGNLQRESESSEEAKKFFRAALTYQQEREKAFAEFKSRFERFDMAAILTPSTMNTTTGRAEGHARLAEFRALLAERKSLLETHYKETERFINERAPESSKAAALQTMRQVTSSDVSKTYENLNRTQSAMADGMAEMLDWTERNQGKMQFASTGATFANPAIQLKFKALVQRLMLLEADMQGAVKAAEALQLKAATIIESNTANLQNLAR